MIRVTEPLNYFKEPWYIDWVHKVGRTEANKISKKSMAIGTRVDELIKNPTMYADKKDKPEVHTCMAAYRKWLSLYTPLTLTNGKRLLKSIEELEVTGEPDLFAGDVLIDIKCSSKISRSYWIQVNMYRKLQGSEDPVAILRLDKDTGSYEYVVKDYDPFLCDVWLGMARAMVYLKGESDGADIREGNIEEAVA